MNNDYTQITISLAVSDLDAAAAIAHMAVPYGFYTEDYSELEKEVTAIANTDLIDEDLLKKNRTHGAIHVYISSQENPAETAAFLRERLDSVNIAHKITFSDCRAEDWENNWKQYFKPMPIGSRLIIVPEWLRGNTEIEDGRRPLYIDPGLAFGTGHHATTRLCLELAEKILTPGSEVLDVGCGSGILGVAALLLGAKRVSGLDIDPVAVRSAGENAALNGYVPPVFSAVQGTLSNMAVEKYDVVLANIVADVLMPIAPSIVPRLRKGGRVILSGIIELREDEVVAAYKAQGFSVLERREDEGWVALVLG